VSGVVAVFGGSGGLGEPICLKLAEEGRPLLIGYFSGAEKAQALSSRIEASGGAASCRTVDIRDPEQVQDFLAAAQALPGGLAAVVNAVGPPIPLKPLIDVSSQDFQNIMATDVAGAFNVLTASARLFAERGEGAIVQLLTTAVLRTLENDGMSGIPKTAVMGIVKQLAREVGQASVRINAIAPGVIDAGIVHSSFTADEVAQGVIELCLERTPMPRLGQPFEVAALASYLLSDGAGYINGQVIGVDGGYSA
jgi:3-oxoacyl-[acyl-carrier protein] reductase